MKTAVWAFKAFRIMGEDPTVLTQSLNIGRPVTERLLASHKDGDHSLPLPSEDSYFKAFPLMEPLWS